MISGYLVQPHEKNRDMTTITYVAHYDPRGSVPAWLKVKINEKQREKKEDKGRISRKIKNNALSKSSCVFRIASIVDNGASCDTSKTAVFLFFLFFFCVFVCLWVSSVWDCVVVCVVCGLLRFLGPEMHRLRRGKIQSGLHSKNF